MILHIFFDCIIPGNYENSLRDAAAATDLQPTFLKAIERGKMLTTCRLFSIPLPGFSFFDMDLIT